MDRSFFIKLAHNVADIWWFLSDLTLLVTVESVVFLQEYIYILKVCPFYHTYAWIHYIFRSKDICPFRIFLFFNYITKYQNNTWLFTAYYSEIYRKLPFNGVNLYVIINIKSNDYIKGFDIYIYDFSKSGVN